MISIGIKKVVKLLFLRKLHKLALLKVSRLRGCPALPTFKQDFTCLDLLT